LATQFKCYNSIDWNPQHHRLRCNSHITNLAAQAFLFPENDKEALVAENNTSLLLPPTEQEMAKWRQKGPLGKLHNIVVHIQRSAQRIAQFKTLSAENGLVRDNSTRWNSWYLMLSKAIRLKEAIDIYCIKYKENEQDSRKLAVFNKRTILTISSLRTGLG
jgi:hypothetical protein